MAAIVPAVITLILASDQEEQSYQLLIVSQVKLIKSLKCLTDDFFSQEECIIL